MSPQSMAADVIKPSASEQLAVTFTASGTMPEVGVIDNEQVGG